MNPRTTPLYLRATMVAENAHPAAHERDTHNGPALVAENGNAGVPPASSRPPTPDPRPPSPPPSPPRDPALNSLICAILDPYESIEEIAKDRNLTVMQLAATLDTEPATSAIETLRKVFSLRAEMLALHARAAAVGRLTRITTNCDDAETARRAATTLLRMFRPDGTPAPQPPQRPRPTEPRSTEPRSTESRSTEPRPSGSGADPAPTSPPTTLPLRDNLASPKRERGLDRPTTTDAPSRERVPTPAMSPSSGVIAGSWKASPLAGLNSPSNTVFDTRRLLARPPP